MTDDMDAIKALAMQVQEHYGERCPDGDRDCQTCQMWEALDILESGLVRAVSP